MALFCTFLQSYFVFSVLSKNELKEIDEKAFQSLKYLTSLDLSHNQLQEIFTLSKLQNLQNLNLQGNKITKIEDYAFKSLPNLVTLNLNLNDLTGSIQIYAFSGLTNLKNLTLSSNELSQISPDVLKPLPNLVKLHLDSNQLKNLPTGISYLKKLQYL